MSGIIDSLLSVVKEHFSAIGEEYDSNRKGEWRISYFDALVAGFSVMHLKLPSLLRYEKKLDDEKFRKLYGINVLPSDTRMRELLDEVDPVSFRPVFKAIIGKLRRSRKLQKLSSARRKISSLV